MAKVEEKFNWTKERLFQLADLATGSDYWANVQDFLIPLLNKDSFDLTIRQEKLMERAQRELTAEIEKKEKTDPDTSGSK